MIGDEVVRDWVRLHNQLSEWATTYKVRVDTVAQWPIVAAILMVAVAIKGRSVVEAEK